MISVALCMWEKHDEGSQELTDPAGTGSLLRECGNFVSFARHSLLSFLVIVFLCRTLRKQIKGKSLYGCFVLSIPCSNKFGKF